MFILDANVLIASNRLYYPLDRVPEFWEWLTHHGEAGNLKMPLEIMEEVLGGTDDLAKWLKDSGAAEHLLLDEDADPQLVSHVTATGYGANLTDEHVAIIGRDPFLIAAGLADVNNRCVITGEVSAPSKVGANRKVPDVCDQLGVKWKDPFALFRELDFSTNWRARIAIAQAAADPAEAAAD